MQSRFTTAPGDVSEEEGVFLADHDLGDFLDSPAAGVAFWKEYLLPACEALSVEDARAIVSGDDAVDTPWH